MSEQSKPLSDALEGLLRTVRSTIDLQQRMIGGAMNPGETGAAYAKFLREELLPYGRTITELTVDYYKALAAAARDYGTAFYEDVLVGRDTHEEPPGDLPRARDADKSAGLSVTGEIGSKVVTGFTLENSDPDPAHVTVEAGVCRGPGGVAFPAPLVIEPAALSIAPGEERRIVVAVELDPTHFEPEVVYRLPLHVSGPRPATIDVTIVGVASTVDHSDGTPAYLLGCPRCGRRFERKTDDLTLRPHKTPDGDDCPERDGTRLAE